MIKVIKIIVATILMINILLFDIGCYFLQKDIYDFRKKGGYQYE